jgi:hypothetical protein
MKKSFTAILEAALLTTTIVVAGCGGTTSTDAAVNADAGCPGCPATDGGPGCPGCPAADAGCPGCPAVDGGGVAAALPATTAEYPAWLATNAYQTWLCDSTRQAPVSPSPHGQNIICINPTLAAARGGSGPWPVGSAAVKITYNAAGAEAARFLDVRKSDAAGAAGWNFTWPAGNASGSDMAANGCTGCHSGAPRDFVYRIPAG